LPGELCERGAGLARAAVTREHVQFLEEPPQRPYVVIGIITPESGKYETEAEAVKAMRKEAAKHGADAIYIESATQQGGWRFGFSRWGGSGGSFSDVQYRAKAIVWKWIGRPNKSICARFPQSCAKPKRNQQRS
jgi:hypothetical protein